MNTQPFSFRTNVALSRVIRLLLFPLAFLLTIGAFANIGGVPNAQYNALVAFYKATGGNNWVINDGWLSSDPVESWFGVTVENGQVTGLTLSSNNLMGFIPAQITQLPLTNLQLDNNQLSKVHALPASLFSFDCSANQLVQLPVLPARLQYLNLSFNRLPYLPALPAGLQSLNVSYNQLKGRLTRLPAGLISLSVSHNQLNALPPLPVGLSTLDVSDNLLCELPALPASLSTLVADHNKLISLPGLPEELTFANLSYNRLDKLPKLPSALSFFLNVANNRLSFEDLEPVIGRFSAPYQYAPQAAVGEIRTYSVLEGSELKLWANAAGNTASSRYVWLRNGQPVSDTLTTPYFRIAQVSLADTGVYTAKVTSLLVPGLVLDRNPLTVKVQPSKASVARLAQEEGTSAEEVKLSVTAYPNPFVDAIQVSGFGDQTLSLTIFDLKGKVVYQAPTYANRERISLGHLPAGAYILSATDGNRTHSLHLRK